MKNKTITYSVISCFILLITLSCSKSNNTSTATDSETNTDSSGSSPSGSPFTQAAATTAFNGFYNTFFNTAQNLFYETSDQSTTAQGWAQAIFFDIALDNYARTKSAPDSIKVNNIYQGAYNNYSGFVWNGVKYTNGFIYDDMMWWVLALMKAYNVTGRQHYLDTATAGFNFVWNEAYDSAKGAMLWSWKITDKAYNACINYPTVIAAMMLYNISHDSSYLAKAKKIYAWTRNNLFQDGRIADNVVNDNPPDIDENYTYNQGTCIGAAILLYDATQDQSYLNDATATANYTQKSMCNANGILPAESSSNEQGVMKAIFAQYIYTLIYDSIEPQNQYLSWIKANISAAWQNRDQSRSIMYRDYTVSCPMGTVQSYEASSGVEFMQLFNPKISQ